MCVGSCTIEAGWALLETAAQPSSPPQLSHPCPIRPAASLITPHHSRPCPAPQEFIAATLSEHQMQKAENMRAAFQHFDTDNSGTISKEELRVALKVRMRPGRGGTGAHLAWHGRQGGRGR